MNAKGKNRRARDVAYWSEAAFLSFTEDLLKLMGDNVTQAELARRVGVSRGYISRVFRGHENLTLETMTKLAIAVGGSVRLHVAPQNHVTRWKDAPGAGDAVAEESPENASRRAPRTSASEGSNASFVAPLSAKARHHK